MKTEQLIQALAQDAPVRLRFAPTLALAVAAGTVLSAIVFCAQLGLRADIGTAIGTARYLAKFGLALLLAVTATGLAFRMARPGVPAGGWRLALLSVPLLLAIAVIAELATLPRAGWVHRLHGHHAAFCMAYISILAIAPLAALLLALRQGAPRRPSVAGAIAGLAAGGIAASLYAGFCAEDSPLFVAAWYTVAIAGVTAVGGAIGSRLLRW